jgi:rubrerythrin
MKNAEDIANFLKCASFLEEKTSSLYKNLAYRIEFPLIESLMLQIACDSKKHAALFDGLCKSIGGSKLTPKDCQKKMSPTLVAIDDLQREIMFKKMDKEGVSSLIDKLKKLESDLGEEYFVIVETKTLEYMVKEINEIYNVQLRDVKNIFEGIIKDEETHLQLLSKMLKFIAKTEKTKETNLVLRYQNPDAWRQPEQNPIF